MRTDDLIEALAASASAVGPAAAPTRLGAACALGFALTLAGVAAVLGFRPDLADAVREGEFWTKVVYIVAVAVAAGLLAMRLRRPEAAAGALPWLVAAPFAAMAAFGLAAISAAPPDARAALWLGGSWSECPPLILAASVPVFIAVAVAFRAFAPTRLRSAGFAAGLLSGAVGALAYALHCPESGAAFIGTWYALGMLAAGGAGAAVGPWALRW